MRRMPLKCYVSEVLILCYVIALQLFIIVFRCKISLIEYFRRKKIHILINWQIVFGIKTDNLKKNIFVKPF